MDFIASEEREIIKYEGRKKTVETLDDLIQELHKVFAYDDVDVDYVSQLMLSYKSNPTEWKKYAKFDRFRYTRNLVDEGNGKFNLMILCWGEGHASAIHDHSDAHCFMKILKGELEEIKYAWPEAHDPNIENKQSFNETEENDEEHEQLMVELGKSRLETNGVCYINDSLGLHRVQNPSHADPAISLHLYSPPFDSCNVFNQQTGHKTKCNVTFWSKFGQKRNKEVQDNRAPEDN